MLAFIIVGLIAIIIISIILLTKKTEPATPTVTEQQPISTSIIDEIDDLKTVDIGLIDQLEGHDFELYVARLLVELGYKRVYKTTNSRDFGADVVFVDRFGNQTVIQTKRHQENNIIGVSAVQEVYTSKRYYKARNALVLTNSTFSSPCETLAGVNHVLLLDRSDLKKIISYFITDQYENAQSILESDPRVIHESWNDMKVEYKVIRKDKKADHLLRSRA